MKLRAMAVLIGAAMMTAGASGQSLPNLSKRSGLLETYNVNKAPISLTGAFFQSLGTNGRSCASCHLPTDGWSVSAAEVQLRFLLTQGLDPIFRTNDGSNCDQSIDTSTMQGRRQAYSLLLSRGLIRIALSIPAGAEFTVQGVSNPYGCSDTSTEVLRSRTESSRIHKSSDRNEIGCYPLRTAHLHPIPWRSALCAVPMES